MQEVIYDPQSRKSHVSPASTITSTIAAAFYQCRNITPPPQKPALRLCMSVLCLQGVLILIFLQQLIVFAMLALYPLIQVLQQSRFIRVTAIEFLKLMGTANKVPCGVLGRIWVIAFPTNAVLQRFPYQLTGQYFFNFLFIIAINLNQQGGLFFYLGNRLFMAFYSLLF